MTALQAWGRLEAKLRNMGEARRLFRAAAHLQPDNEYVLQVRRGRVPSQCFVGNRASVKMRAGQGSELHIMILLFMRLPCLEHAAAQSDCRKLVVHCQFAGVGSGGGRRSGGGPSSAAFPAGDRGTVGVRARLAGADRKM